MPGNSVAPFTSRKPFRRAPSSNSGRDANRSMDLTR